MNKKAIVLLSGGLDSATTLYFAKKSGYQCHCLVFDYNQRHSREIESAKKIAKAANCEYKIIKIDLPWKGSSLLDKSMAVCRSQTNDIPSTYVPARNIIFLSFALSCAEVIGAEAIFIGANAVDYSGYPDCRPEFYKAFFEVAALGTKTGVNKNPINILTPLIDKTKADIVRLGRELGVPYELTWSCYEGADMPCGYCDSCKFRAKGFKEAGMYDPVSPNARVQEIFTSIQGEGVFSGKRQIFVRFFGCNLSCNFCDTPQDPKDMREYSLQGLFSDVTSKAGPKDVHSVSITGGEPLLQADFLRMFLPKLKQSGYKVYLETNGALPENLKKVIDYVDIVAMDIKLPSSTSNIDLWKEHAEFLNIAMKKQIFVKIVVTSKTTLSDFNKAVFLVTERDPHIALVIQPVTSQKNTDCVNEKALSQFKNIASEHLRRVRVIPQMHKLYGIR